MQPASDIHSKCMASQLHSAARVTIMPSISCRVVVFWEPRGVVGRKQLSFSNRLNLRTQAREGLFVVGRLFCFNMDTYVLYPLSEVHKKKKPQLLVETET